MSPWVKFCVQNGFIQLEKRKNVQCTSNGLLGSDQSKTLEKIVKATRNFKNDMGVFYHSLSYVSFLLDDFRP